MKTVSCVLLLCLTGFGMAQDKEKIQTKEELIVQQLKDIQTTLNEIRETTKRDIADLDNRLKKLESKTPVPPFTDKIKGRVVEDDENTTRQRIEVNRNFDPPNVSYGSVRIKNTYVIPITAYINGAPYKIPVNETRLIEFVPSGTFTYSIAEVNDNKTVSRNLKAEDTYDLVVYTVPEPTSTRQTTYPTYYPPVYWGNYGNCPQR